MNKLWFRCISCNAFKFRSPSTYTIVLTGKEGLQKETFMCGACGDMLSTLAEKAEKQEDDSDDESTVDL